MTHPAIAAGAVAVVTGGASGIGLAAAKRFAQAGMRVAIADLGDERVARAAEAIAVLARDGAEGVLARVVDVSQPEQLRELEATVRERFGGTDVLMNNAGIGPATDILGPSDAWHRIISVNLWGAIHGTQIFLPDMIARDVPPDHQHRLETGHHHAARQSRLQRVESGIEGLHRSARTSAAQHRRRAAARASADSGIRLLRTDCARVRRRNPLRLGRRNRRSTSCSSGSVPATFISCVPTTTCRARSTSAAFCGQPATSWKIVRRCRAGIPTMRMRLRRS